MLPRSWVVLAQINQLSPSIPPTISVVIVSCWRQGLHTAGCGRILYEEPSLYPNVVVEKKSGDVVMEIFHNILALLGRLLLPEIHYWE